MLTYFFNKKLKMEEFLKDWIKVLFNRIKISLLFIKQKADIIVE